MDKSSDPNNKNTSNITGRGAAHNPKNRFEKIEIEPDFDQLDHLVESDEESKPETIYLRDHSRSIITTNDSPDVGFDASINPYRGCSHGCVYCMDGDTLILMGDGRTKPLKELRVEDEIFGTVVRGRYRRYVKTEVLAHWKTKKEAYRVTLGDGTSVVASGDHRFLTERGWKYVVGTGCGFGQRPHLTTNNKLMGVGQLFSPPEEDKSYKLGYLCGVIRGDGHIGTYSYKRNGRAGLSEVHRSALCDREALERASKYLLELDVKTQSFVFQKALAGRRDVHAIRTSSRSGVERVVEIATFPSSPSESWRKGFLAGIFDAEGSHLANALRISNTDTDIVERIVESLRRFGFRFILEVSSKGRSRPMKVVRICGGLKEHLRFFHSTNPAISRKRNIEGIAIKSDADLRVESVEPLEERTLYDITTGTGDFIANGVVSHNCFARPNHEYLGFSAGLDFETRIMVKEDAPELLRKELSSKKWKPRTLAMSVATDAYQPIEKKLEITRRCLEVLAEFRNPVAVVTKNYLVARDIDLLSELAKYNAASVMVSLTTLDDDLRRRMEPRTSSPSRRLAAIEKLSDTEVPVGVMAAPVIPGLTDHELPKLLEAAANAGATSAGYTMLRLPYAVAPLFEDWLVRNYPDRREKILGRIREIRGGKLNDPRFGSRMKGEGFFAEHVSKLFAVSVRKAGINRKHAPLSAASFRIPEGQPSLFD
ncbi:MAG: PA0069 family radical SAM protein [Actinomycetota bacterium]|nr:PA0069 family radical SAM protein [Rubrobacter sp.]MDQ3508216.1 PA0069 family radical SAM protein [Actinomycetota bacterium]